MRPPSTGRRLISRWEKSAASIVVAWACRNCRQVVSVCRFNHPAGRADGTMLPCARGVITTPEGAQVMFDLSGRTVFVGEGTATVGRQLLMTLFESEHERYRWLNNTVCLTEGRIEPLPDREPRTDTSSCLGVGEVHDACAEGRRVDELQRQFVAGLGKQALA